MGMSTRCNVFSVDPLIQLMKDVIPEEVNCEILQTDLIPMEYLVQYITTVLDQLPEAARETLVVWLQLLQIFLTEAKSILHRSDPPQRCFDCIRCNPRRLSKQIKKWRVRFTYLFQALERDFLVFVSGREAVIAPVIAPVIPLMKDVIQDEEDRHILQTELRHVYCLLLEISVVFDDQQKAAPEALKIWLQLLNNSLTEANSILHDYGPLQRQRRLDCLRCNPRRLSKQIKKWRVRFNYLFQPLEREFSVFVSGREAVIAPVIARVISLMKDVIQEEENCHILQTELRPVDNLLLDINDVFQYQQKTDPEALKRRLQLLHISLTEANRILYCYGPSQRQRRLDGHPGRPSKEVKAWQVLFNYAFQRLQGEFSMFFSARQFIYRDQQSINRDPIQLMSAQESIEGQSLSTDEAEESIERQPLSTDGAWMLFKRIAFKDNRIPTDIEEYARNIADECKGFPLAIPLIAAAMTGKTRVDEWKASLYSMKNADPSFQMKNADPDTLHPQLYQLLKSRYSADPDPSLYSMKNADHTLHPQLYQLLKWSYDALPNSDVKNCFLYCAMYPAGEKIYVQELVQMWIAEGLVRRSKQESHLMDMAIGLSYVNLLVDRCLFQWETEPSSLEILWGQRVFVEHDIREMAIYIGEKEENCLFKAGQRLQGGELFIQGRSRISLLDNHIQNLRAELPCPKLVSLLLSVNVDSIPSRFLVCLTSLKVLHLHSDLYSPGRINSIPSSVGQLKQLEFLSLQACGMEGLPEEICHLSSLKFLDLKNCSSLQSLPPKIGELKNLRYLSLRGCFRLKVIPHEISQLTSLTTLDADNVMLRVEAKSKSEASIWSLKGFGNLTMLRIYVKGFKEGIMGTWLDMRHLCLAFGDGVKADLPHDMTNMRKLQSFQMWSYSESSLPDYSYKFQHLEDIYLDRCDHLRELSPLERLPSLKGLFLHACDGLKELGIGFSGRPSGFLMLGKLALSSLRNLESIAGPLNNGVWNESTLPKLRILKIKNCRNLKRFPMGTDKLLNLSMIAGQKVWWQKIIWEDHDMQVHLEKLFKEQTMIA